MSIAAGLRGKCVGEGVYYERSGEGVVVVVAHLIQFTHIGETNVSRRLRGASPVTCLPYERMIPEGVLRAAEAEVGSFCKILPRPASSPGEPKTFRVGFPSCARYRGRG